MPKFVLRNLQIVKQYKYKFTHYILGMGLRQCKGVELLYVIIIIYDDVAVLGCLVLVICAKILPKNDRHMEYNDKHRKGVRGCKEGGLDMNE